MKFLRRLHWFFVAIPLVFGLFVVWSLATASVEPISLGGPIQTMFPPTSSIPSTKSAKTPSLADSQTTSTPYVSMLLFDNRSRNIQGVVSPLPTDRLLTIARNLIIDSGLQGEVTEDLWHLVDADDWAGISYLEELSGSPPFIFVYSVKGDIVRNYHIGLLTGPEPPRPEALSVILDARDGYLLALAETYVTDPIAFAEEQSRPQVEYFETETQEWAMRLANKATKTKTMAATLYGTPTPNVTRVKPESTAELSPESTAER